MWHHIERRIVMLMETSQDTILRNHYFLLLIFTLTTTAYTLIYRQMDIYIHYMSLMLLAYHMATPQMTHYWDNHRHHRHFHCHHHRYRHCHRRHIQKLVIPILHRPVYHWCSVNDSILLYYYSYLSMIYIYVVVEKLQLLASLLLLLYK